MQEPLHNNLFYFIVVRGRFSGATETGGALLARPLTTLHEPFTSSTENVTGHRQDSSIK